MKAANESYKINETSEIDFSENICELTSLGKSKNRMAIRKFGMLVHC